MPLKVYWGVSTPILFKAFFLAPQHYLKRHNELVYFTITSNSASNFSLASHLIFVVPFETPLTEILLSIVEIFL